MRAELKRLHSPDVDFDSYWPDDIEDFSFLVQAMIGVEGDESEESFGIQVCTPKWLLNKKRNEGAIFGRHLLLVFEYDLQLIESQIESLCRRCSGDNWQEVAQKLSRYGQWEFEDYQPHKA